MARNTNTASASAKGMTGKSARKVATTKATEAAAKAKTAKAPAKAKTAKAPAKAEPKARGLQGVITITDTKFVYGTEGTERRRSWDALSKQTGTRTIQRFKELGGRVKYLKRWQAAGVITIKGAA
jgi:hypothetical protein